MIDQDSETWNEVRRFVSQGQQAALQELTSQTTDFPSTQFVRGKLHILELLKTLPERLTPSDPLPTPETYF